MAGFCFRCAVLGGSVLLVSFVGLIIAVIILSQYISVGQGFLYEDLKNNQTTEQNERNA